MSLYSIVFLGSTPIGAPLVGWLAEVAGPRSGLYAGAAAALAAAVYARWAYARVDAAAESHRAECSPRLSRSPRRRAAREPAAHERTRAPGAP